MPNLPTPTAIKLVTGNPGKRPMNDAEPSPSGEVCMPDFVTGDAVKVWEQYAPDLEAKGVLTAWDVAMFGAWCCLMAEFAMSPKDCNSAKLAQLRALASSFGLDPSSRSRLKTSVKDDDRENPAAKYLA